MPNPASEARLRNDVRGVYGSLSSIAVTDLLISQDRLIARVEQLHTKFDLLSDGMVLYDRTSTKDPSTKFEACELDSTDTATCEENDVMTRTDTEQKRRPKASCAGLQETVCAVVEANNLSRAIEAENPSVIARFISHPRTDVLVVAMVVLNAVVLGLQVSFSNSANGMGVMHHVIDVLDRGCDVFFCIELILRVIGLNRRLLDESRRAWFLFDASLVVSTCAEFVLVLLFTSLKDGAGAVTSLMQGFRVIRVLRAIRMINFLPKLQMMVEMVMGSLASLMWLFVFSAIFCYAFAIMLTDGALAWQSTASPKDDLFHEKMNEYFGTISRSAYTLFISSTGGISWGEPASVALRCGKMYFVVYCGFMFVAFFSVLNVVTGVVVDGAIQQANSDRLIIKNKQREMKEKYVEEVNNIITEMDKDNDGKISKQEWKGLVDSGPNSSILACLDIKKSEAMDVFALLDIDGDGELSVDELVRGLAEHGGHASRIDVHFIKKMLRRIGDQIEVMSAGCESDSPIPFPRRHTLGTIRQPRRTK